MKTAKVYMVRKHSDFEEVKTLCKKYAHEAEEVLIEETVSLPQVWDEALCQRPLDNYIFLFSKGGYDDFGRRKVVAIKCLGKPTLYVEPSGSSYCRYMGVENYDEITLNHKISMPMVYNHAIRVLDRLDRRLSKFNTPAQPLKYKYEINRLAHKLEQMVTKYKSLEQE